jgi:chromosome segregation ATPase
VSELKRETALGEVSVKTNPIDDEDDLDALLGSGFLEEETITEITNILNSLSELDSVEVLDSNWLTDEQGNSDTSSLKINELIADRDRLQTDLECLRSQHEFECEYVDQLEKEIISVTNDRERQVAELTKQLEKLQKQINELNANPLVDDRILSDRLAMHVLQIEEEFQHRLAIVLEIETQKITQQYLQEIKDKTELINQLQGQNTAINIYQQTLTEDLKATQLLVKELNKTLEIAQTRLSEVKAQRDQFEEELIKHLSNQAQLHQSLRGLENEYVSDLTRVQELEQQIEELQNQVLHQASKASEYEAAIQHWKEQSVSHQHHALQLSGALERFLSEKPVRPSTATASQSHNGQVEQEYLPNRDALSETRPARSPHPNAKVDLPSFLVRHR